MCENRGSFGNRRGETTGMIEVRMRVDDEADGLVGDGLLGCRHYRHTAGVVLSTFDDEDVVAHIDRQRRIVSANLEGSFTQFFYRWSRWCSRSRRSRATRSTTS